MLVTLAILSDAKCVLKSGQAIAFGSPYLEKKVTNVVTVPAAHSLGISPAKIFNHLRKFVGDDVKTGDLLGINKGLFSTKKIYSEYTGVIKEIDHHNGNIVITTTTTSEKSLKSFFKGDVVEVKKNEIVIELKKGKEYSILNATDNFGGEVSYSTDKTAAKIIVAATLTPYTQLKLEAVGITGFILLTKLGEKTDLPVAQIKNIDDFKEITKLHFPYCLIDKEHSKIYFYA